jgi:hypothetical protein
MYGTYLQMSIDKTLEQMHSLRHACWLPMVKINPDGSTEATLLFEWSDQKSKNAFMKLAKYLDFLVGEQYAQALRRKEAKLKE